MQRLELYYLAFFFRFAVSSDFQSGTDAIYPLPSAFGANFKDASDMVKAARKNVAFGAPHSRPALCKDRFVLLLERQGSVIFTINSDNAFDARRSAFRLFSAKRTNSQIPPLI